MGHELGGGDGHVGGEVVGVGVQRSSESAVVVLERDDERVELAESDGVRTGEEDLAEPQSVEASEVGLDGSEVEGEEVAEADDFGDSMP